MIITEFLPCTKFNKYGDWLKSQNDETKELYFGTASNDNIIDSLIDRISSSSNNHYILVARNRKKWVGTLHIAVSGKQVEFGVIVAPEYRGQGIANIMLEQALIWARNRGYRELFMHCLGWNKPIQHLCQKHGLKPRSMYGDSEVQIDLDPASWTTVVKEMGIQQRNIFHTWLQNYTWMYQEIYG